MPLPLSFTLKASTTETTSGQAASFDLLGSTFATDGLSRRIATLLLEVTAASGTFPELTVTVETSPNATSWQPVLSFEIKKAVGFQRLKFAPLERYVRATWVATAGSGSPSFTFAIAGTAEVIYAGPDDFYGYGLPKAAVGTPDPTDLLSSCLLAASSQANAWIPRAYKLPLKEPYPDSLKKIVCELAAYKFLSQRGFDPDDPADKEIKTNHDAAREWLDSLGEGAVPDWVDATPEETEFAAAVVSAAPRGW